MERWKKIREFPRYSVSNFGRVINNETEHIMTPYENQYRVVFISLSKEGKQHHRSLPLIVASAFVRRPRSPEQREAFDTPINLDGDRHNNHADNLVWRPRWFAVKYNRQFHHRYNNSIHFPIVEFEERRGKIYETYYENSFHCAISNGLLEQDVVMSILNATVVWPTYQAFGVIYPAED